MDETATATLTSACDAIRAIMPNNALLAAIAEWTHDAFRYEPPAYVTLANIVRHLETCDCAACHAPAGLIYNTDIAAKAAEWWNDIDEAIDAYHDATGENPAPRDGALTVGWLVWFAVEWYAQEAARAVEALAGEG